MDYKKGRGPKIIADKGKMTDGKHSELMREHEKQEKRT